MNLLEIKQQVMFQTNNDADDLGDFLPHLTDYINEGYDLLVNAWCGEHVSEDSETYTPLNNDRASPELPAWTHRAITDWATWLIYRNGNAGKQNRGMAYRMSAESFFNTVRGMTNAEKGITKRSDSADSRRFIYNIPL